MLAKKALPVALIAGLSLTACGTTPGDRTVSGGLLGAGTGAVIGSLAGHVGEGALIGGLGGALLGAVTSPSDLYMGEPPWHESATPIITIGTHRTAGQHARPIRQRQCAITADCAF